jgi:hypothetical protein
MKHRYFLFPGLITKKTKYIFLYTLDSSSSKQDTNSHN